MRPTGPMGSEPAICRSRWLVADPAECDTEALERELRESGRCPERLKHRIIETGQLQFDLSPFARDANTLELFTFLRSAARRRSGHGIGDRRRRADLVVRRRDAVQPSFAAGRRCRRSTVPRVELPSRDISAMGSAGLCGSGAVLSPPLRACLMFGDPANNHLDEITLEI